MGNFSMIGDLLSSLKQSKLAKRINPVNTTYAESVRSGGENPFIQALYGEGRNLYQGRMAGAGAAEQNILTNQANTLASAENNATDSSQVLAIGAGLQGQTDQALSDLASREGMDKQRRFGAFSNVSQLMAEEGDKVYQDKLRKYYDDLNYKRALQGASMQNLHNSLEGMDQQGEMAASLLSGGYIGGRTGGGGQRTMQQPTSFSQLQGNPQINYNQINSSYPRFQRRNQ